MRPVARVEDGAVFRSASEAARAVWVSRQTMWCALNRGGTAGGWHWRYV